MAADFGYYAAALSPHKNVLTACLESLE
jgi:hypothetical protein